MTDTSQARSIAAAIADALDGCGYSDTEMVYGCIQAAVEYAFNDDDLLDQAANLLADGGVIDDTDEYDSELGLDMEDEFDPLDDDQ